MKKILVLALVLIWTAQAFAGMLVWTDEKGNTHYTDDEKKIPEKYRQKATEPSLKDPIVQSNYRPDRPGEAALNTEDEKKEFGGKPLFYWIQQANRMEIDLIEAQNTVTLLENELKSLKHIKVGTVRRNPIVGKYYSRMVNSDSSLYYVDENEKSLLEMKLNQVKKQVEALKKELEIFGNDAKKAQVPPKYM